MARSKKSRKSIDGVDMDAFYKEAASQQEAYAEAQASGGRIPPPPPGDYTCALTCSVAMGTNSKTKEDYLGIRPDYEVLDGKQQGYKWSDFPFNTQVKQVSFLKGFLTILLGREPSSLSDDIIEAVQLTAEQPVVVEVKVVKSRDKVTGLEYDNTYVNSLLGDESVEDSADDFEDAEEDDGDDPGPPFGEDNPPSKDDDCTVVEEDGEEYTGTIKSINTKAGTAVVSFPDFNDASYPWDEIWPA